MNPPAALKLKSSKDANLSWKKFKQSWMLYEIASGIKEKSPEVRLATFLHVGGEDAIEKYNGFTFDSEEDQRNLEVVIEKFDRDCQSNINVLAARYEFYNRRQQKDETYDQYVTQLRGLSIYCDFTNLDEALRDQFVFNIRCEKAKTKLINDSYSSHRNLSFDKAFAIAKATEITLFQAKERVENNDEPMEVNRVNTDMKKPYTIKNCKFCGKNHEIKKCPAYGKMCSKCKKLNHFAAVCKSGKKVNSIEEENSRYENSDEDSEEVTEIT